MSKMGMKEDFFQSFSQDDWVNSLMLFLNKKTIP